MIKIGNQGIKDIKKSGDIVKVLKGTDLVWKKAKPETLIYTKSGSNYYKISINNWSDIRPNKNYRFITNKGGRYSIFSGSGAYTIRNKDVFRVNENCDITIRNGDYNLFELKIYETTDEATIIF